MFPLNIRDFCWPLFTWQFRQLRVVTILPVVVATLFVLWHSEPLEFDMLGPVPFFVLIHSVLVVWILGRVTNSSFGFLYVQGYSRDALWTNTIAASFASVIVAWLPVAVLILLGIRSGFQEGMNNFNFPLMAETEHAFVWWCLLAYCVLLPIFHYAWIRGSQPTGGAAGGFVIAMGAVFAAFSIWNGVRIPNMPDWTVFVMASGFAVAAFSLFAASRKLHRQLEVMS